MDLPESEISVDTVIVTAILDRILRHSTINIKGNSEKGKGIRERTTPADDNNILDFVSKHPGQVGAVKELGKRGKTGLARQTNRFRRAR